MNTIVKPFSSNGEIMEFTLNHDRKNLIQATICPNPNNRDDTAILEFNNGDTKIIKWSDITFMRDLNPWEK